MELMIIVNVVMILNNEMLDLLKRDVNFNVILKDLKISRGNNKFLIKILEEKLIFYIFYVEY